MKKFILIFIAVFQSLHAAELPYPYNDIEVLPFNKHGWFGHASRFKRIFYERRKAKKPIKTVVEVGSWLGSSTRCIASLLPPGGKVFAIDHWQGVPWWEKKYLEMIPTCYQQFLSNVIHKKLTNKIVPIRMKSLEAAKALNVKPDMVFIDSDHGTAAVYEDLCAWYPFVKGHGIICGDDWGWQSVRVAVERFAKDRHLRVEGSRDFWRLHEY